MIRVAPIVGACVETTEKENFMANQVLSEKKKVSIDEAGFRNASNCYGRDRKIVDAIVSIGRAKGDPVSALNSAVSVLAKMRGLDTHAQRMLKAVMGLDENVDPVNAYALAQETIGLIVEFSERGSTYTPAARLGFGSDPSHIIARKILGTDTSAAKVRATFAKVSTIPVA